MSRSLPISRFAIAVAVSSAVGTPTAHCRRVPHGYTVHTAITLPQDAGPRARRLEVLEDSRIVPAFRKIVWGGGYPETGYCYAPQTAVIQAFCTSLKQQPLRRVVVRIVTGTGTELDARVFERELADVTVEHLYATRQPTYLVTVDYSTGTSTYSGQGTRLLEVRDDRLHWLQAADDSTHQAAEIQLGASIKGAWRIAPVRTGRGEDVLEIHCGPVASASPGDTALTFQNHLVRYHFDGAEWRRSERIWPTGMPGWPIDCWEGEGEFPPTDSFP
jgi:hypothetical protein